MKSHYYTRLTVVCDTEYSEILMAEIAEAGFDTFMETEKGFEAYGEEQNIKQETVTRIQGKYKKVNPLLLRYDKVEKQNWNEEWEKNVDPIIVDDSILVRAAFHKIKKKYPHEIIITPKMSFGTGHHQTTYLMLKNQLTIDHKGKIVMDAGCGTAILSIMAAKLGATKIEAFDIDDWSVTNSEENVTVNKVKNVTISKGTIKQLSFPSKFDIVLANINKNVLLDEMEDYTRALHAGGRLLLSGFYVSDCPDLVTLAMSFGLREITRDQKDNWAALAFRKK